MSWRSVIISNPAYLSLQLNALVIKQGNQESRLPLEDISVLVIDHPQVTLTSQLLVACPIERIVLITIDANHLPVGALIPFLPHHRALKVIRLQMGLTKPQKKRLHQQIIKQKIINQSKVLARQKQYKLARKIEVLEKSVASGDPGNIEAQVAKLYFQGVYRKGFNRKQERFYNSAMNYCYSVIRSAIARSIVCHGLLPIFGLFHNNEQNAFNLADDLMEPFRPCVDAWILYHFPDEIQESLSRDTKQKLVGFLHTDIQTNTNQQYSVLALSQALVISLIRVFNDKDKKLLMPVMDNNWPYMNEE